MGELYIQMKKIKNNVLWFFSKLCNNTIYVELNKIIKDVD